MKRSRDEDALQKDSFTHADAIRRYTFLRGEKKNCCCCCSLLLIFPPSSLLATARSSPSLIFFNHALICVTLWPQPGAAAAFNCCSRHKVCVPQKGGKDSRSWKWTDLLFLRHLRREILKENWDYIFILVYDYILFIKLLLKYFLR